MTESGLVRSLVALVLTLLLAACSSTPPSMFRETQAPPAERTQAHLQLAMAYLQQGQTDIALQEIGSVLQTDPAQATAWHLQGMALQQQGQGEQAERSLRQALQLAPQDAGIQHNLAVLLCERQQRAEADRLFASALTLQPPAAQDLTLQARAQCASSSPISLSQEPQE